MEDITKFAESVRDDAPTLEKLKEFKNVSEVAAFVKQSGYQVTGEELRRFLDENRKNAPDRIVNSIAASGNKIDFTEESIVRFSAVRLQIDTDY